MRCRSLFAVLSFVSCLVAQTPAVEEPATVVEGRIVDMRGDGVPVASVRIVEADDETKVLARTTADGEGFFRLAKVPTDRWLPLRASADGYCTGIASVHSSHRSITVQLQHAVAVRGALMNRRGEPVPDAVVRAMVPGRSLFGVHCDARTDGNGRFELAAVPLAPVQITAWVPDEGLAELTQHVVAPCEVALQSKAMALTDIRVTVEGLPADATTTRLRVLPYRDGGLLRLPPPHDRPLLDAEGHWELQGAPDWDYTLGVSSPEFAIVPDEVRVKSGAGPHVVRFTAKAIATAPLACRAVVRDPQGRPVSGLRLRMGAKRGTAETFATSDADGRLEFSSPLAAGAEAVISTTGESWVLDQKKADDVLREHRFDDVHEFRVDPTAALELQVVQPCTAHGRLLLSDGRPASFVSVRLLESQVGRTPQWMAMTWTTTGRDGAFRFVGLHHLSEAVRIHVEAREGSFDGEPFLLDRPGTVAALGDSKLQLPSTIEGIVRDDRQQPLPGLRVWLRDWDFDKNSQRNGSVVETLTDRDGRYRFVGVPVGGAWLQLLTSVTENHPRTRAVEPFAVEAGKTYTFDLQVPGK